jgi:hypothetical protein
MASGRRKAGGVTRALAVQALAITVALLAVFGGAAMRFGSWPSGADATVFAAAIAVGGALVLTVVHWPVLASLRRRGVRLAPARAALVGALGLNAPVYAALAVVGRDRSLFAAGEAALLALGFGVMAALFGAGYASIGAGPRSAADFDPEPRHPRTQRTR